MAVPVVMVKWSTTGCELQRHVTTTCDFFQAFPLTLLDGSWLLRLQMMIHSYSTLVNSNSAHVTRTGCNSLFSASLQVWTVSEQVVGMQGRLVLLLRPRLLHDVVITSTLKCVLYVAQINNVSNGSWKINKESDTTSKDCALLVFFFQSYMQLHYYWTKENYNKSLYIPMIFFFVLVN